MPTKPTLDQLIFEFSYSGPGPHLVAVTVTSRLKYCEQPYVHVRNGTIESIVFRGETATDIETAERFAEAYCILRKLLPAPRRLDARLRGLLTSMRRTLTAPRQSRPRGGPRGA